MAKIEVSDRVEEYYGRFLIVHEEGADLGGSAIFDRRVLALIPVQDDRDEAGAVARAERVREALS